VFNVGAASSMLGVCVQAETGLWQSVGRRGGVQTNFRHEPRPDGCLVNCAPFPILAWKVAVGHPRRFFRRLIVAQEGLLSKAARFGTLVFYDGKLAICLGLQAQILRKYWEAGSSALGAQATEQLRFSFGGGDSFSRMQQAP